MANATTLLVHWFQNLHSLRGLTLCVYVLYFVDFVSAYRIANRTSQGFMGEDLSGC